MKKFLIILCFLFLISCTQVGPSVPPIVPSMPAECQSDNDCITGGCSGTICQPKDAPPIFTTCEWKDEYACFKEVSCSCLNNNCKWDDQKKLDSCIQSYQ